ncbi:MAG: hypothetical protein H7Z16_14860 [Pyrinomonadaceae bacterium]|nr:hypothetical protein [Pyrinomonadaceae bacterium]
MKRCQKCNRTYPDDNQKFCTTDGGLLINADQAFDPNATIQSTAANMGFPVAPPAQDPPVDLNATIATSSTAETAVLPRNTGPTGSPTFVHQGSAPLPPQTSQAGQASLPPPPPVPQQHSAPLPSTAVAPVKKKSKLPLILGIVAVLLVLGAGALVALFFLVIKPRLDQAQPDGPVVTRTRPATVDENLNTNSNTTPADTPATTTEAEFTPPAGALRFENSQSNLDGKLADHYLDFSFYYPQHWTVDPKAGVAGASNFAKVERMLPKNFTQENFAVGWYTSKGTVADDSPTYPQLVELMGANLAKGFPGYRKVSEGPTKINDLDGYEFRFVSVSTGTEKGDIQLWGRVVFLPTGVSGDQTGATLIMLATSLAPELSGVDDVGEKGEMPLILESFRFGKKS